MAITKENERLLDSVTNICKNYIGTTTDEMLSALTKDLGIPEGNVSKEFDKRGITEDKKLKQAEGIIVFTDSIDILLIIQKTDGKITSMEIKKSLQ